MTSTAFAKINFNASTLVVSNCVGMRSNQSRNHEVRKHENDHDRVILSFVAGSYQFNRNARPAANKVTSFPKTTRLYRDRRFLGLRSGDAPATANNRLPERIEEHLRLLGADSVSRC
jgi:hypothetical protein